MVCIATTNHTKDDEQSLAEGKDTELEVGAGSEVPTIEVNDGIVAAKDKGIDQPLLAGRRDGEHEVVGGSKVPTVDVGDGTVAAIHKGGDKPLLFEERDTKHDLRQETIAEDEAPAPAPICDDYDSWLAIEELSDADYKGAQMAKEADEVDISSWDAAEVVVEGVIPTPI